MSYEGYVVYYCGNGHLKSTKDAYVTSDDEPCKVCGNEDTFREVIDQTNGCECNPEEGYVCNAHPKVTEIIGYTMIPCEHCNGTGGVPQQGPVPCDCGGKNKACILCFGTGDKMVPIEEWEHILCPKCWGRKTMPVPIFDLNPIKKAFDKFL